MSSQKVKAMNFPISKITIGDWTFTATYPYDIVGKLYFARKQLLWEFLPDEPRSLKRKMEIQWDDVLSFQESFASRHENGILKFELSKRPKFYIETNPQAGKQTQWKQMEEDFTGNQASIYRIHTLHFDHPGVLQENLEKLLSYSFWSKLHKVRFPTQEAIHFNFDYGNGSNYNNSSHHFPSQTPLFNVDNDLHYHSQGISRVGVEEGNFDMTTHFWTDDYGWQNSYTQPNSWNHTANELFGTTPAITPLVQEGVEEGNFDMTTHFCADYDDYGWQNSYSQPNSWINTANELSGTPDPLPLTQVINEPYNTPYMNISPMYPQVGPNLEQLLLEDDDEDHPSLSALDEDLVAMFFL